MSIHHLTSLEDLGEFEEKRTVNTPRSLEACDREGVDPSELLYKPLERFAELPTDLQELHFQFLEKRRQDTLKLLRNTRMHILEEKNQFYPYSSSARVSPSPFCLTDLEKAKEKHIKFINQIMEQETVATDKMQQLLKDKEERELAETQKREERMAQERLKLEAKRRAEIEAALKEKEQEKASKRAAFEEFRRMMDIRQAEEQKMKEKQRLSEQERQEREALRRFKFQRVEATVQQQLETKAQLYKEKLAQEAARKHRLFRTRKLSQKKMETRSRANSQKRKAALENLEQQTEEKRRLYYEKKESEDRKTKRFLDGHKKSMETLRQVSSERNSRIIKTRAMSEKLVEETRLHMLRKSQESDQKVQEAKARLEEEMQRRKQKDHINELKKELNIQRHRRREEYKARQAKKRLDEQMQRVETFSRAKSQLIGESVRLSTENDIQKYYLKEALHKMTVSKKWNFDLLKDISQGKTGSKHRRKASTGNAVPV